MAKKSSKVFVCSSCGTKYMKWQGRCDRCGEWNQIEEEVEISVPSGVASISTGEKPKMLKDISMIDYARMKTGISEFDISIGGGIVPGSLTLIGGDPGIGKSTLLLQIADSLARQGYKVLYISGEESSSQTKLRASRLGVETDNLYISSENNMDVIQSHIKYISPKILIVDSIQTVYSSEIASTAGSVTQIRENANKFLSLAKGEGITTFLVGHVTKTGTIAGPKVLEHMVDTVLYFEGENSKMYRILRAVKNRFGSVSEIGVFEMTYNGLKAVDNPSALFLSENSGGVIFPIIEGSRTVLVEMQCLVSDSSFSAPRRMAMGIDYNKLVLLIAILEKKLGYQLYKSDIYINIVGGVDVDEPSADLAVIMAIISSFRGISIPQNMVFIGEVGLTGEIRSVSHIQQRINEAKKMGFEVAVVPKSNMKDIKIEDFKVLGLSNIKEVIDYFV